MEGTEQEGRIKKTGSGDKPLPDFFIVYSEVPATLYLTETLASSWFLGGLFLAVFLEDIRESKKLPAR